MLYRVCITILFLVLSAPVTYSQEVAPSVENPERSLLGFSIEVDGSDLLDVSRPIAGRFQITSLTDIAEATIRVMTGGIVFVDDASSLFQNDVERPAYYFELPVTSNLKRDLGPLSVNEPRTEGIVLGAREYGYGYISASLESRDNQGQIIKVESVSIYFYSDGARVFSSRESFLEAKVAELRSLQSAPGSPSIEEQIEDLRQGGARSSGSIQQNHFYSDRTWQQRTTLTGRITYQTVKRIGVRTPVKISHPVRGAEVALVEDRPGRPILATARTNEKGDYTVSTTLNPGETKNLYVVVRARGQTSQVVKYVSNRPSGNEPYAMASEAQRAARAGQTYTRNIDGERQPLTDNNDAFEILDAVSYGGEYIQFLQRVSPNFVSVNYPHPKRETAFYKNGAIFISKSDAHDWDKILHEFGHHVEAQFDLSSLEGVEHDGGINHCKKHGRDLGLRTAWSEGWPNFFSLALQKDRNLIRLNIDNVGDTFYTDTQENGTSWSVDLEAASPGQYGEGNENAIARVLWDLYDNVGDAGDSTISLGSKPLWDAITRAKPRHFSQFWATFTAGVLLPLQSEYAKILAAHGFVARPEYPPSNAVLSSQNSVQFRWNRPLDGCAAPGKDTYAIAFYAPRRGAPLYLTPFSNLRSVTISAQKLRNLTDSSGSLRWIIAYRDTTGPSAPTSAPNPTGPYYTSISDARLAAPSPGPSASIDQPAEISTGMLNTACDGELEDIPEESRYCVLAEVEDATTLRILKSIDGNLQPGQIVDMAKDAVQEGSMPLVGDGESPIVIVGGKAGDGGILTARKF